jgi:tetratricopeptide (TPR) repeat protein/DNA-binding XRE family transcriptional regulator
MNNTVERESRAESVGQRLRRLRLERGLSQRSLAGPGVSYAYISRIEADARRPSVKALRLLARKLMVSPEYLERGSDLREADERELELVEAELEVRLGEDSQAAEAALVRVLEGALASGETATVGRARIGLGLAAARAGRDAEAVEYLEAALTGEPLRAAGRPDVYATLGRAYSNLGEPRRAVSLFEGCLAEVRAQDLPDPASEVRYATYLSYSLTDAGDLDRAERVLNELAEDPPEAADPYTRVRLFWALGRLSTREGRTLSGLAYFRRAVALLEATEDTLHLARAHLSCAWALTKSGRAQEANRHLEVAEELFGPRPDPADLGWLRTEQAKRVASLGRGDEAIAFAQEALASLGTSDPGERGDALWALAEGYGLTGDIDSADATFRQAVELLAGHRPSRDCAAAYRAWAKLLRRAGRETDALDVLEQAAELAARHTTSAG